MIDSKMQTQAQPQPGHRRSYHPWLILVSVLTLIVFFLFPPITVFDKTHAIGYAICHQMPSHTIHINGTPLPLCARCTGIYLGALWAVVAMIGLNRHRATDFPPLMILFTLVGFIGLMGIDGINSFLDFFPGLPSLYEPQNWLRLTTGTLDGLAMAAITFPIINGSLWHPSRTKPEPVIQSFREVLLLVAGAGVIVLLVLWRQPLLLYPLMILSTAGVILMLGMINTALVLMISHREGYAHRWRNTLAPILMGLAISFLLVGGMDWLRAILTQGMDLPY